MVNWPRERGRECACVCHDEEEVVVLPGDSSGGRFSGNENRGKRHPLFFSFFLFLIDKASKRHSLNKMMTLPYNFFFLIFHFLLLFLILHTHLYIYTNNIFTKLNFNTKSIVRSTSREKKIKTNV